ncbi:MAG: sugar ABC transporter substrate-binding protein [Candidatus Poribacteria bacterium]|nr:sugar ABC transporter substrate-binding protein [Candidatus Poribacteria bacterium]
MCGFTEKRSALSPSISAGKNKPINMGWSGLKRQTATFIIMVVVMVAGCTDDSSRIKIGVSVPETTAPAYTLMKQAMVEREKEYGIKILWHGVRDEGATQDLVSLEIQQIRKMLKGGIRVLIFTPADGKAAYPVLKEASRWRVPVITLDRLLVGMRVRGHIAVNQAGLGETAARYAIEQIGYKGNVLLLEGPIGDEPLRNIALGIYRVLDQHPDEIRIYARSSSELSVEAALDLTDRLLKNYAGNIQAIIAVDSTLAVGAARGVHLHGLTDQIVTVGVGAGEEACRQIMLKQHDAEVDLMPYERGLEALQAALDALNGLPFSYHVELPNGNISTKTQFGSTRLITSANYLVLEQMWPDLFEKK